MMVLHLPSVTFGVSKRVPDVAAVERGSKRTTCWRCCTLLVLFLGQNLGVILPVWHLETMALRREVVRQLVITLALYI